MTGCSWGARQNHRRDAGSKSSSALRACTVPGVVANEARNAVDFDAFFSCEDGTTPEEMLRAGIYNQIAIALKGGPWRHVSLVLMAQALALQSQAVELSVDAKTNIVAEALCFGEHVKIPVFRTKRSVPFSR
jgi:hypothetical protein